MDEALNSIIPGKEQLEQADDKIGIITLVKGKLEDDSDFYAYLAVKPSKYMDYLEAEKRGNYTLEEYGTVLASGKGSEPPAEVVKEMEEKYGATADFEANLVESAKKACGGDE